MKLLGRRIHLAGSAAANADEGKLRYAHLIISQLVAELLKEGAAFVIPLGKEPLLRNESNLPPLIFDWTVAEVIATALDQGLTPMTSAGRIIATVATSKTDSHIPNPRKPVYEKLRAKEAVDLKFMRSGWTAGALQRQKLADTGDILIVLSGGQGVEHLAVAYSSRGKPVIPLDLQLGSFSHDGSGGAARLFDRALENPEAFFRIADKSSAADLLDKTRTRDGSTEPTAVVQGVITLLRALEPPQVFYVRILNKDLPDYPSVEMFFQSDC